MRVVHAKSRRIRTYLPTIISVDFNDSGRKVIIPILNMRNGLDYSNKGKSSEYVFRRREVKVDTLDLSSKRSKELNNSADDSEPYTLLNTLKI